MVELDWPVPGLGRIRLNRGAQGNAFSAALVAQLDKAVQTAEQTPGAHSLAFVAAGAHFSTGMDLSGLEGETDESLLARFLAIEDLLARVWASSLRTVALVQGRAWGAAADLVVCCDHRLARADSTFRFPGAQFGLVLGTRRLACRIGSDRARAAVLQGETLHADEALACGLLTQVLPKEQVSEEEALAGLPPLVVDGQTQALIHKASRAADDGPAGGGLAMDRSMLQDSAVCAGLQRRMQAYLARLRAAAVPASSGGQP